MNKSISVVILHYNNSEMTINYINNLKKLNWGILEKHFIVVDNCSPDYSGKYLFDIYKNSDDVTVILNSVNMGFAKGNNLGIKYAANQLMSELIIVSNNDIYIEDIDFPQKLWNIYQNSSAAVIGPDIYSLNKKIHQSPIRKNYLNEKQLKEQLIHIDHMLKKIHIIDFFHLYNFISRVKRLFGMRPGKEGVAYNIEQCNVVLQGAFFVLSRQYMESYTDGLYNGTFLYMEEDILAYRCKIKNLKTLYTPKLKVFHYDGYSTNNCLKGRCAKYIFELEETRKSCGVMLKLLLDERLPQTKEITDGNL